MRTVTMVNSVDEHIAGEEVELEDEVADRFVLLGYAEGELSREYDLEELAALRADNQEVSV